MKKSVVIIGAGVVGCAVAQKISELGYEPFILEAGPRIAEGVTSRNSGVIHAGIYYKPNSLKANSCIRGSKLLYEWCSEKQVPHKKTGKYIVAQKDEVEELEATYKNAVDSGAKNLSLLGHCEIEGVRSESAILSEDTGIVDPYEFANSMLVDACSRGASIILNTKVLGIEKSGASYRVHTSREEIESEIIINCAGLASDEIAEMCGINKYKIYPWRGEYFKLNRYPNSFKKLIYPVKKKNAPGLGVHLTLALDGSIRLGPDVEYKGSKNEFGISDVEIKEKKETFFLAAKKYLPALTIEQLSYDSCGIRPKLRAPEDKEEKDFIISEDLPGFINLVGIESPGLTASRDLAERVARLL